MLGLINGWKELRLLICTDYPKQSKVPIILKDQSNPSPYQSTVLFSSVIKAMCMENSYNPLNIPNSDNTETKEQEYLYILLQNTWLKPSNPQMELHRARNLLQSWEQSSWGDNPQHGRTLTSLPSDKQGNPTTQQPEHNDASKRSASLGECWQISLVSSEEPEGATKHTSHTLDVYMSSL